MNENKMMDGVNLVDGARYKVVKELITSVVSRRSPQGATSEKLGGRLGLRLIGRERLVAHI